MSIIIKGMEMPKEGNWKTVRIYPDGTCAVPYWSGDCKVLDCTAIPLPEGHGRLIDVDELMNRARGCLDELTILSLEFLVNGSSTIVPAEGGTGNV